MSNLTDPPQQQTPLVPPDEATLLSAEVAVRTLCDFAARRGDLDLRFTPSPSGVDGVAGHNEVTARRAPGYQREVPLHSHSGGLRVQGRADGWDPSGPRLEEIKTHRGDAQLIAPNRRALHWAQARVYAWMLCEQLGLERIEVALVYFNIDTGAETLLLETQAAVDLHAHFEALCERYHRWARQELAHRQARNTALRALRFPFPAFRAGQRDLAGAVYRAHKAGRTLMAQAPTGIGKTLATLFAALRALPEHGGDKLFYLTPRTTGRQLALDALERLGCEHTHAFSAAMPLRVIERVARDKACEHPDKACHGDSCPLACGFYDRLPAAREQAAQTGWLDKAQLRELALAHDICPYYLGQEMLRWADVAVGDVNHFFDLGAHWHGLAQEHEWQVDLLVDEAHNLIERCRAMYSATLDPYAFQVVRQSAPPALRKALDAVHQRWNALAKLRQTDHQLLDELPGEFLAALQMACSAIADHFAQHPDDAANSELQGWFFEALQFQRVAELFGEHSVCELQAAARTVPRARVAQPQIGLRNLVPGPLIEARWQAVRSATLFSATLSPMNYLADLLGLPPDTLRLDVPSPFAANQLHVQVAPHISTRWRDRLSSLTPMADVMAQQFKRQPGNYLAFFSSFEFLQQALDRLRERHPSVPTWAQSRGMSEAERDGFISRFTDTSEGMGFAVLGGAFGEGIDLPGRRLIGAFIATLGLPQVNPVNELLRARLQAQFGRGYDYAYLFPGLQKVVQAAGRVIRSESDRGTVWLLDDRYAQRDVRAHLPAWWGLDPAL